MELTDQEINEALREFCCDALTDEQHKRFEERSDFGELARARSMLNDAYREIKFTESLNGMALVRAKMSEAQQAEFAKGLARHLLPIAFHEWAIIKPPEAFKLMNADAATQARIALEVIRSDLPAPVVRKLDLAREHLDSISLSGE